MFFRRVFVGGVLFSLASLVFAANLSGSGLVNATPVGQRVLGGCGTTTLTQSTAQTITNGASVSCNAGGLHTNNSYFRAFSLGAFPDGFDVISTGNLFDVTDGTAFAKYTLSYIDEYNNTLDAMEHLVY